MISKQLMFYIVKISNNKKTIRDKIICLVKGIIFLPFLFKDLKEVKEIDVAISHPHEIGGDIYPLF